VKVADAVGVEKGEITVRVVMARAMTTALLRFLIRSSLQMLSTVFMMASNQ
jgi:ABC-type microcin C transport system permease subunit YejE